MGKLADTPCEMQIWFPAYQWSQTQPMTLETSAVDRYGFASLIQEYTKLSLEGHSLLYPDIYQV
jgi:hypothetical protein